jgi:PAS domain S-box-containing protein
MSNTPSPDLLEQLARLREDYHCQLAGKLAAIDATARHLEAGPWLVESARALQMQVHKLAGSAGTFGMPEVSEIARALELALTPFLGEDAAPAVRERAVIGAHLTDLRSAIGRAMTGDKASHNAAISKPLPASRSNLVYVVEDDTQLARIIAARLTHEGYTVRLFGGMQEFLAVCATAAASETRPAAVIMDIILPEGRDAGLDAIADMKRRCDGQLPVIFISVRDDIETRLRALRLGATRYLAKPLDIDRLAKLVDDLTQRVPAEPYRVLLVDDDEDLLAHYKTLLYVAGMEVHAVSNPLQALEAAAQFRPDVMVLDVYMPECTGLELAAILREGQAWSQIPIIYLSVESNLHKQLLALDLGGDEFLTKPIEPAHFVMAVAVRAKRSRHLRQVADSLRQALRERDQRQTAFDQHAIVSVADASGRIIYANSKFTEISGYTLAELLGQNHRLLKSGVHPASFYEQLWKTISGGQVWRGEICNRKKDGGLYWVESTIMPFLDASGRPYQYISVRTDITQIKQDEERLRHSQIYANIGTWDWDIQTGNLYWSERIAPLFGYPSGKLETTYDNFLKAIHPDDRQAVIDAVGACVERGVSYNIEHRCVWPDGTVRWLLESGDVVRSAEGRPLHMLGVVQDITARKHAEIALTESRARLEEAQTLAQLGNWEADLVTSELRWSEEIFRIFGQNPASFTPSVEAFRQAVHPEDAERLRVSEQRAAETGVHDVVHRIIRPGGEVRYVHELARSGYDTEGCVVRLTGTVQDVTDLKQAEQALIVARDEADRANRAKSEFLSSMSHELRTPMNAILGFAQLLEIDTGLNAEQQDEIQEILKAGHHLLELINDVLDLARIEAGRVDLSIEPVLCDDVLHECLSLVRPLAEQRGIRLVTVAGCDGIWLRADRIRLKQVLLNLLSNAVKYNRPQGQVSVDVSIANSGRVRIHVRDTGPGIPSTRIAELFQPFNRLGAETSDVEGTGIGLVISRRLIEMMGGSIGVESTYGTGSDFWLELQRDDVRDMPAGRLVPSTGAMRTLPNAALRTLLYIEDNPANLKLVMQILAKRPHLRLLTAHTPALGLDIAAVQHPELILLDINMPDMDGYEVLALLRAQDWARELPIVAITANAMASDIQRGRAAGFTGYLTKPLDVHRFLAVIDQALGTSRGNTKGSAG